jgi:hypothetical protein
MPLFDISPAISLLRHFQYFRHWHIDTLRIFLYIDGHATYWQDASASPHAIISAIIIDYHYYYYLLISWLHYISTLPLTLLADIIIDAFIILFHWLFSHYAIAADIFAIDTPLRHYYYWHYWYLLIRHIDYYHWVDYYAIDIDADDTILIFIDADCHCYIDY